MIRPLLFLQGSRRIVARRCDAGRLVELCRRRGFVYRNLSFSEECVSFSCTLRVGKKVGEACARAGIPVTVGEAEGLPGVVLKYRKRYGILLGLSASLWLLFASGQFLWSVRVEGNEQWSNREILRELEACGVHAGLPVAQLNTAVLENRILMASDKIAWISLNRSGNVLRAVVREKTEAAPPSEDRSEAVNLVAARAGEIVWLEEVRGNPAVVVGDLVGKGDLLVGGIYGKEDAPLRYTRASGKVMARTEHRFEVRIPLQYEKKEYTGTVKTEKYWIFFEKEIKFFGNTGNWSGTCDTIDTVEYFEVFPNAPLPIGVRTVSYAEYRTVSAERSVEEAEALARTRLRSDMAREVPDGMLVRQSRICQQTDSYVNVTCRAEFFENIAIPVKIELEGFLPSTEKK